MVIFQFLIDSLPEGKPSINGSKAVYIIQPIPHCSHHDSVWAKKGANPNRQPTGLYGFINHLLYIITLIYIAIITYVFRLV